MTSSDFERQYFDCYLESGRVAKRARAAYWASWIGRRVGQNGWVVEVGSGRGDFVRAAHRLRVIGSDVSDFATGVLAQETDARVMRASADALPIRPRTVSAVVALDVIEHLPNPASALHSISSALRPGGLLIMSVPNLRGYGAKAARSASERETRLPWCDPTHISLLEPEEWRGLLEDCGFRVVRWGTDFLWQVPYPWRLPASIQRAILVPLHVGITRAFGFLPWSQGENLVAVARSVPR